jgi:hypothetical protein
LEHRNYSWEELENELVGIATAFADAIVVPERFGWYTSYGFTQGLANPFLAPSPENLEGVSTTTTGPRLELPIADRTTIGLTGTYARTRYEESNPLDSNSLAVALGVFRQISGTTRAGLVADREEVEYPSDSREYEIETFALRYERRLAAGDAFVEAGESRLTYLGEQSTGPLLRLTWHRVLSPRSDVTIRGAMEFTDAASLYGRTDSELVALTENPTERTGVGVVYQLSGFRTNFSVDLNASQDDFAGDEAFDNKSAIVRLNIGRAFTIRMRAGITHERTRREFSETSSTYRDSGTGAWLDRRFGQRLSLRASLWKFKAYGQDPFDESRYEIRLSYRPTR